MKLIKLKHIRISSDGSLTICQKYYANIKKVSVQEKDNKNFHLNKKNISSNLVVESSSSYRKNILAKY